MYNIAHTYYMVNAMKENEKYIYNLIEQGIVTVTRDGHGYKNYNFVRRDKKLNTPKEIKQKNTKGYIQIEISKTTNGNTTRITAMLHRMIWIWFNGEIPDGMEINHINGQKTDNRIENLEVVTHRENVLHAYRVCHISNSRIGANNSRCKFSWDDIKWIAKNHRPGERHTEFSTNEIAKKFNVGRTAIQRLARRNYLIDIWPT